MIKVLANSILLLLSISVFATVPVAVPSSGLQAWYSFNGSANNDYTASHNGLVMGAVQTTGRFGKLNSAYLFDGVDDYINIGASILNGATTSSVSCWIQTNQFTTPQNVFQKRRNTNGAGLYVGIESGFIFGALLREPIVSVSPFNTPFVNFNNSTWTHIVLNNNNGSLSLYVNGALLSQVTLPQGALVGNEPFYIGKGFNTAPDGFGVRAFSGKIDDVGIWNRVLTLQEIQALYTANDNETYYSKPSGSLTALSTWGTETDGTGTAPLSFDSSNVIYNVVNGNTNLTGDFIIGGANSTIVFGNGTGVSTLAIAAGDTVYADSMYVNNSMTLTVAGALHSNKLGSGTNSSVQYISSIGQQLAKGTYENLIVSSSTKQMYGNITVRGVLGMVASINTNGNDLTLGTSATSRGTLNRSSGTVIGKFTRWYTNAVNSGTTGLFPVGSAFLYNPFTIEYTSAPTSGGRITCEFIPGLPGEAGLPQFDFTSGLVFVDKIAIEGVLRVTTNGVSGGNYTATYVANNYTGVNTYTNLRLVYRTVGGNWTVAGTAGTNTGSNAAASVVRTGLGNLTGEFAIGGDKSENPLPIKLLYFTANQTKEEVIELNWKTAYELNADKFIVERSLDFNQWSSIHMVQARGFSSSTTLYKFTDNTNGNLGSIYYRLIEIDKNGTRTICGTASVDAKLTPVYELTVYPNPAKETITVKGLTGSATIYNLLGVPMGEMHKDGKFSIVDFPQGVYVLKTSTQTLRFIKD